MKLPRRQFLHLTAGAAALPTVARIACAQAYPTRPVRMIVPFPPAGSSDILARLIGPWLSHRLGQPFVIENRPGAATNIGTEVVVRAPPDGHTLLVFEASQAINATHFLRDIAPIAAIIRQPLVMAVHPSVPAKTVPEFIAQAKANPGMEIEAMFVYGRRGQSASPLPVALVEGRRRAQPRTPDTLGARKAKVLHQVN